LVCLVFGCRGGPSGQQAREELRVQRGTLRQRHLLSGAIEAVERTEIKVPRTREHRLQVQWLAADGAIVAVGDKVLEFDNTSFTANLDQQRTAVQRSRRTLLQTRAQGEARLREAEAAVERARIELAKAEIDVSVPPSVQSRYAYRSKQLEASKARAVHDKAIADLRSAQASVEAENRISEERLAVARRELEVAEEAVHALVLHAPRAGIVVVENHPWEDRKFQVGDMLFAGWTAIGIPNLEKLRVRAALSDVDDGRLEVGMPVICTPDIAADLQLRGRIGAITPIAREQRVYSERRGFDVIVELLEDSDDVLLVPGMSVRVEVETESSESLLVPRAAIDLATIPPRALRHDGSWAMIEVKRCSPHFCVLAEGLAEGERLLPTWKDVS
jgi:multidrug efflux pump subunit AcrA (membrane-fusion protein)